MRDRLGDHALVAPASSVAALTRILAGALGTAAAVKLGGGGDAYWLCVPVAMLVSATSTTTVIGATTAGATIVAAAAAPLLGRAGAHTPQTLPALLVPALSIAVMLWIRGGLERERDSMRAGAFTDSLTGIGNRRLLLTRIDYEIARHARSGHGFAVVMIDLDGFKQINDRFGHPAGDEVLREVAASLRHALRDQDTLARIGGDEFCVLAPETDTTGSERLQARILTAAARVTTGIDVLAASAGVAVFPQDGKTIEALLDTADAQLLSAKRHTLRGRSRSRRAA